MSTSNSGQEGQTNLHESLIAISRTEEPKYDIDYTLSGSRLSDDYCDDSDGSSLSTSVPSLNAQITHFYKESSHTINNNLNDNEYTNDNENDIILNNDVDGINTSKIINNNDSDSCSVDTQSTKDEEAILLTPKILSQNNNNNTTQIKNSNNNINDHWHKILGKKFGQHYYMNSKTFEIRWTKPASINNNVSKKKSNNKSNNNNNPNEWIKIFDEQSQKFYYYNNINGIVTWDKPKVFSCRQISSTFSDDNNNIIDSNNNINSNSNNNSNDSEYWVTILDSKTGEYYYYNRITKQVTWDKPNINNHSRSYETNEINNGSNNNNIDELTQLRNEIIKLKAQNNALNNELKHYKNISQHNGKKYDKINVLQWKPNDLNEFIKHLGSQYNDFRENIQIREFTGKKMLKIIKKKNRHKLDILGLKNVKLKNEFIKELKRLYKKNKYNTNPKQKKAKILLDKWNLKQYYNNLMANESKLLNEWENLSENDLRELYKFKPIHAKIFIKKVNELSKVKKTALKKSKKSLENNDSNSLVNIVWNKQRCYDKNKNIMDGIGKTKLNSQ